MRKKVSLIVAFAMLGVAVLGGLGFGIWNLSKKKTPETPPPVVEPATNVESEQTMEAIGAFCDYYELNMMPCMERFDRKLFVSNPLSPLPPDDEPQEPENVPALGIAPFDSMYIYQELNFCYSLILQGSAKCGETTYVEIEENGEIVGSRFVSIKKENQYIYVDISYSEYEDYFMTSYINKIEAYDFNSDNSSYGYLDFKSNEAAYLGFKLKDSSSKTIKDIYLGIKTKQINLNYIKNHIAAINYRESSLKFFTLEGLSSYAVCNTCVDAEGNFYEDVSSGYDFEFHEGSYYPVSTLYDFTPTEQTDCLNFFESISSLVRKYDDVFKSADDLTVDNLQFGKYVIRYYF